MHIPFYRGSVPYLTTAQMVEVDRAMMEDYRIDLPRMMENAGRNLAHLARVRFLANQPVDRKVVILAGPGGNGGGALVCARRLHNWGARVEVVVSRGAADFAPVPGQQLDILRRMQVPMFESDVLSHLARPELIIDGIIGYSLQGAPHGAAADLIRWANAQPVPILALDAPSGVDTTTGTVFDPAIRATATLTLALPKEGLRAAGVDNYVGELYLADISVPPGLYAAAPLRIPVGPLFAESDVIRLR